MLELEQKIQREIEENPVLDEVIPESEEEDAADISLESFVQDVPTPSYKLRVNNQGKDLNLSTIHSPFRKVFTKTL